MASSNQRWKVNMFYGFDIQFVFLKESFEVQHGQNVETLQSQKKTNERMHE